MIFFGRTMIMKKSNLDEMQLQKRNKIGNEAFLTLMYLLLLDTGLHGFGFRWLSYPVNIVAILSLVSAIYIIRLIRADSYIGVSSYRQKPVTRTIMIVLLAVASSVTTILLIKGRGVVDNSSSSFVANGIILFIISVVCLTIVAITAIMRHNKNKQGDE